MPKLWLFDFDNTLARLEPCVDWAASRRELEPMLREAGAPKELFERFPKRNLPLYEAYRAHVAATGMNPDLRATLTRASEIIEKFELAGADRAEPLEGALDLLAALDSHGAKLGIVTSNSSRTVRRWLDRNGVASLVHVITGRDLLLPLKPAPDLLTRALETAGVTADDAVYVGDVEGDFVAAHRASVGFHGIANSEEARDRFLTLGVREVFSSPAALLIYLNLLPP